ncbi:MAG: carboxypeptidase regulatory-like domain-containing protein [Candidatus Acidiferrales bacterium]
MTRRPVLRFIRQFAQAVTLLLLALAPFASTAEEQSAYKVIKVDNGGTISGTVRWVGPAPKPLQLPITKNADICDPDSRKTANLDRLEIGTNGDVANTVVYLKDVSEGKPLELPESREQIDQRTCRYWPHILLVPAKGALRIKSSDPILHTVHMSGAANNNIPFPFQDQYIPVTLQRAGVVDLKCNAGHVWMNAEVLVVKHPYYAVTDSDGAFRLTDVPPGEYEIVAWHEGWKILREETVLDVAAQVDVRRPIYSAPVTWEKKVVVRPGESAHVDFAIGEK